MTIMTTKGHEMPDLEVSVAEAKRNLSDLLGRVAYGNARVLIAKRGRPMAILVPPGDRNAEKGWANVRGWLDDDDPLFAAIEEIEVDRAKSLPRCFRDKISRKRAVPRKTKRS